MHGTSQLNILRLVEYFGGFKLSLDSKTDRYYLFCIQYSLNTILDLSDIQNLTIVFEKKGIKLAKIRINIDQMSSLFARD